VPTIFESNAREKARDGARTLGDRRCLKRSLPSDGPGAKNASSTKLLRMLSVAYRGWFAHYDAA
jgi:hypothetical protein